MTKRTVLVIDDDPMNLKVARRSLERHGWEVYDSLEVKLSTHLAASNGRLDVALLDWQPHGPHALKVCRENNIPAVIWTGDPLATKDCGVRVLDKTTPWVEINEALVKLLESKTK